MQVSAHFHWPVVSDGYFSGFPRRVRHIEDHPTFTVQDKEFTTFAKCGRDFCAYCGCCLNCCGGWKCSKSDNDLHLWIE